MLIRFLILALALLLAHSAHALSAAEARGIAIGETEARIAALNQAIATADDKTAAFLQALADDAVKFAGDKVFVVRDGKGIDPVTGAALDVPDTAEDVINNNMVRGEIEAAQAGLKLFSRDEKLRREGIKVLQGESDASRLPLIEKAFAAETNPQLKEQLGMIRSAVLLNSGDKGKRLAAATALAQSGQSSTKTLLLERLKVETEPDVKATLAATLRTVEAALAWGDKLGAMFSGISLGSILLLVALGLAITYGLMGVINMAHGELMMIGAYATYVVQGLFQKYLPGGFDWYLLASVPVAFLASALMGAALERSVIRFLYGRPLETLLATWGISLMLMQLVRSVFGAQNVGVENPSWMSGGWQVMGNLSLPYNRLVIIGFAAVVLLGVALLISRTRLGLFVRGVTQNRPIASCMGVNTARIDTYAFALGSGIAGLAKIAVMVFIIIFIQKRPQGIFAMKGRSAEA
jgi:urea transport system permease protein